jgi:trimeric autotransporter adhesin
MRKFYLLALGVLLFQGAAFAEMISGTVTSVDTNSGKVTLTRSDNQETITVNVKDKTSLDQVQTGSSITLDANKGFLGGWSADTAQSGTSASSNASTGTTGTDASTTGTSDTSSVGTTASDTSSTSMSSDATNASTSGVAADTSTTSASSNDSASTSGSDGGSSSGSTSGSSM